MYPCTCIICGKKFILLETPRFICTPRGLCAKCLDKVRSVTCFFRDEDFDDDGEIKVGGTD